MTICPQYDASLLLQPFASANEMLYCSPIYGLRAVLRIDRQQVDQQTQQP